VARHGEGRVLILAAEGRTTPTARHKTARFMLRLSLLLILGACSGAPEPCCDRCGTVWSEQALAEHERHRVELNMIMYASGCEYCRHHGAYKDVTLPDK